MTKDLIGALRAVSLVLSSKKETKIICGYLFCGCFFFQAQPEDACDLPDASLALDGPQYMNDFFAQVPFLTVISYIFRWRRSGTS